MASLLAPLSAKLILGMGVALALSLGGNFLLVRKAWMDAGEAKVQKKLDAANGQLVAYKQTDAVNTAIAGQKALDTTALLADLNSIAERGREVRTVYRAAAAKAPLPVNCAPGQERFDAINRGLGPTKATP